jgi:hypothetical protein
MHFAVIAAVATLVVCMPAAAQKLYRHVDENGKVVYTDRPQHANQKAEKLKAPNVTSPEASRQLDYAVRERKREEQAERLAQQQRAMAQRQREFEEERERRYREAEANPYSPPQAPARPRAKR